MTHKDYIEKLRDKHKDVPEDIKVCIIRRMEKMNLGNFDVHMDIDELYDDALDILSVRVKNNTLKKHNELQIKMGKPVFNKVFKRFDLDGDYYEDRLI